MTLEQAFELHQKGDLAGAKKIYEWLVVSQPRHCDAWHLLGLIHHQTKNLPQAAILIEHAIELHADNPTFHFNYGVVLQDLGQIDAALKSYDNVLQLDPNHMHAHYNRAAALQQLRRFPDAVAGYDNVIRLHPNAADVHCRRAIALQESKRLEEAVAGCDEAIRLKPDFVEAHYNRGNTLQELRRLPEALVSYDTAIKLKPDFAMAHSNRGVVLNELGRFDEALASYDRALALRPDFAQTHFNRGNTLQDRLRLEEALASYAQALKLAPDMDYLYGNWLFAKIKICDWTDRARDIADLSAKIERGEKATAPLPVLSLVDSTALHRKAAEIWGRDKSASNFTLPAVPKFAGHRKIRIGYYSADYQNHPVSYLLAGLIELHHRDKFEITGFSLGPDTKDDMRKRLAGAFDRFIDVRHMSDRDVVLLSRQMEIDIAVDLQGYTKDQRPEIFLHRAAPLQVNYLGYPGTSGVPFMDYLIADATLIPERHRAHYSEKIISLPHTYQANDRTRAIPRAASRAELGLPDRAFVFCCFNNSFKITPSVFDGWMRILGQVPGSVLWLYEDNPAAVLNLRKAAAARGIGAERLIFAKRVPHADHMARYKAAGLFLDTLPYNAHTTTSDALWAGLPVLTLIGESFPGRVAASLLNAIGLPELITTTQKQYEQMAVELALHPQQLAAIKQKLQGNRLVTPLFDTALFTAHIEDAYTRIHKRHHAGLPPGDLHVTG